MATVHTDNIKEGMVLSEDVRDIKGRLLLKKGQEIQANHMRILKVWGITEVQIAGDASTAEDSTPDVDPMVLAEITEITRRDFRHVDLDHPAMSELFRLSALYRSQNKTTERKTETAPPATDEQPKTLQPNVYGKIMQQEIRLPELPAVIF